MNADTDLATRAKRLRGVVIVRLHAEPLEVDDFNEQYRAAMDDGERVFICWKWLRADEKARKAEKAMSGN